MDFEEADRLKGLDAEQEARKLLDAGKRLADAGKYSEALVQLDRSLDLHINVNTYAERGLVNISFGKTSEAIADFSRAIELQLKLGVKPEPTIYLLRARLYLQLKQYRQAISDCDQVISLDPARVEAFTVRAQGKSALGDAAGARQDQSRADDLSGRNSGKQPDNAARSQTSGDEADAIRRQGSEAFQAGRYAEARGLYETAAASGNAMAMHNLGVIYERGLDTNQDFKLARQWYEKAAARKYLPSIANLAGMYARGQGGPQDYQKARELEEQAAAGGDFGAMYALGIFFNQGLGVEKDYVKARAWFEKAAERGDDDAMFELGVLSAFGRGQELDMAKARVWYEKAAGRGNADAMCALGTLYQLGIGVVPERSDPDKALEWYKKADAAGCDAAKKLIEGLGK